MEWVVWEGLQYYLNLILIFTSFLICPYTVEHGKRIRRNP